MRNTNLVIAVSGAVAVLGSVAFAASQSGRTIQECTKLLPQGRSYTYVIEGTIETAGAEPKMGGKFTVGEANAKSDAIATKEVEGFSKCVAALIR